MVGDVGGYRTAGEMDRGREPLGGRGGVIPVGDISVLVVAGLAFVIGEAVPFDSRNQTVAMTP